MAITLEEAAANIGAGVIYRPHPDMAEDGTITGTSDTYVFVRYAGDRNSKATSPEQLQFLVPRKEGLR